jgi:peptidylprolyl isomerase
MKRLLTVFVVAGLLLASCGSDDDDNGGAASTPGGGATPSTGGVRPSSPAAQPTAAGQASPAVASSPAAPSDGNAPGIPRLEGEIKEDRGVRYIDEVVGTGPMPQTGQTVTVHYTGWLSTGGDAFDSSRLRNQPFQFTLGVGDVIQGWDIGVATMQQGGKRRLIIPAELGYGSRGAAGGRIPPGATLIFDVELLSFGQ